VVESRLVSPATYEWLKNTVSFDAVIQVTGFATLTKLKTLSLSVLSVRHNSSGSGSSSSSSRAPARAGGEAISSSGLDVPLYEDDWLFVCNKPPGILVHPSPNAPGDKGSTLIEKLEARGRGWLQPCHRLDRFTSGVLLLSKDPVTTANVQRMWEDETSKEYVLMVHGGMDTPGEEWVEDTPLEDLRQRRDAQKAAKVMRQQQQRRRRGATTIPPAGMAAEEPPEKEVRLQECRTHFTRLSVLPDSGLTLLRATLSTGRSHQIRRHLSLRGLFIVGDAEYGAEVGSTKVNKALRAQSGLPRMFLHAQRVSMPHPNKTEERLLIEAPLPDDLAAFMGRLPGGGAVPGSGWG